MSMGYNPYMGMPAEMMHLEVEVPDWAHKKTDPAPDGPQDVDALKAKIIENLMLVHDPEIPINIYDLGLIYTLDIAPDGSVKCDMTVTAPGCPVADQMPPVVKEGIENVPGITGAHVELTWDPPWSIDMASEDARLALGFY